MKKKIKILIMKQSNKNFAKLKEYEGNINYANKLSKTVYIIKRV